MNISRRGFLIGCSAAIAALSGSRITDVAFGASGPQGDILVNIFLRGGIDGLNFVVPYGDPFYAAGRKGIRVAEPGKTRGALNLNGFFGLHPSAAPLLELFQANKLALITATGLPDPTRSHFDAMAMMERGTPGSKTINTGWIARHLMSASYTNQEIPALVTDGQIPTSLIGFDNVASLSSGSGFDYTGDYREVDAQRRSIRQLYTGSHWMQEAGSQALDVVDRLDAATPGTYTPEFGAQYPNSSFGNALKTVAQLAKQSLGLQVASIDFGGWDTHENEGDDGQGYYAGQISTLAAGLHAFYTDLTNYANRLTVVVMSEFGRRVNQNTSGGTDHGHGNFMLVLGGGINGGLYGTWPGLATENLDEGKDLAITTDYRQVLGEVIMRRLQNPRLLDVFPKMPGYTPLGLAQGTDLAIPAPSAPTPGAGSGTGSGQVGSNGGSTSIYIPVSAR